MTMGDSQLPTSQAPNSIVQTSTGKVESECFTVCEPASSYNGMTSHGKLEQPCTIAFISLQLSPE